MESAHTRKVEPMSIPLGVVRIFSGIIANKFPRLVQLGLAIASYEGWDVAGSVAQRNKNPGNLRASWLKEGVDKNFAFFFDAEHGWLALYYDLYAKCSGHTATGLLPRNTLRELIFVYAPKNENDSEKYLNFIIQRLNAKYGEDPIVWRSREIRWFIGEGI